MLAFKYKPGLFMMQSIELKEIVISAVSDLKAVNPIVLDVTNLTDISDYFVICSGNSDRHVKSIANHVLDIAKEKNIYVLGTEGTDVGEWVLLDLGDVVVHVMHPLARERYQLEKLWAPTTQSSTSKQQHSR
jgi:ribosome-associated protein